MDPQQLELVIAAILTTKSIDDDSHSEEYVVQKYRKLLFELRRTGSIDRASKDGQ